MALACQLLYVPVCVFTKISLLITYLREYCSMTTSPNLNRLTFLKGFFLANRTSGSVTLS
jgi:hypothetical protein